jgi:hypothetical protein
VPSNTPLGQDVTVTFPGGSSVTFENVTLPGLTAMTQTTGGPPPPDGFRLGSPPTYYQIQTTAVFTGSVEVCLHYDGSAFSPAVEARLRLFHDEDGGWTDVTTSLDTASDAICGEVTSFSAFAAAELVPGEDFDGDGCANERELTANASLGGRRDPLTVWDLFDVPAGATLARDRAVSAADIFGVVSRFGAADGGPGDFDRGSDPLSAPNAAVQPPASRANYHPSYDRGGTVPGGEPWDLLPADGSISGGDISAAVVQFGHSCV